MLRAVARTHLRTGIPIVTHTDPATQRGREQQRVFREEGVDLGAVVIGHCNQSDNLGYLEELIENGSLHRLRPLRARSSSRASRAAARQPGRSARARLRGPDCPLARQHALHRLLRHDIPPRSPNAPYGYLHHGFLPGLRERGATEAQIEQMLVGNPRAYFAGATGSRAIGPAASSVA